MHACEHEPFSVSVQKRSGFLISDAVVESTASELVSKVKIVK